MKKRLYSNLEKKDLILRDHLAIDRTILANEKTLLSYIRTALGFLITGASLIKFFGLYFLDIIGWILIIIGIMTLFFGLYRFKNLNKDIQRIKL